MGCFSGCLMSSAGIQKLFCGIYSVFKCSFDEFVGEKVVSPSYSSTILGPPPDFNFPKFTEIWFVTQDAVCPGECSICTWEEGVVFCIWRECLEDMWDSSHLMFHLRLVFPCYFCLFVLFWWYIHWCELGVKVSYYYCVTGSVSINVVSVCLRYWGVLCIGCIDIHNCYVFLLDWSLDHYVVSFLISCNLLYFKVYYFLIWELLLRLFFALHLHGIYFSILSLSVCMCL